MVLSHRTLRFVQRHPDNSPLRGVSPNLIISFPMSEPVTYSVNEQVIIEDGAMFYLAKVGFGFEFHPKILAIDNDKYKIHYNGWPSRYDKWVAVDELNKDNEMNRALMRMNNSSGKGDEKAKNSLQVDLITEMVFSFVSFHL